MRSNKLNYKNDAELECREEEEKGEAQGTVDYGVRRNPISKDLTEELEDL